MRPPPRKDPDELTPAIIENLKSVYDPEIPVDIYELGLIYNVTISESGDVHVVMTLTSPGCPVAGAMPGWVEEAIGRIAGVAKVTVELVFEPPWDSSRMSDEARLKLNMF